MRIWIATGESVELESFADARCLDVGNAKGSAHLGRFVAVKLQTVQAHTAQHRSHEIGLGINENPNRSNERWQRGNDPRRRLVAHGTRARRMKVQADGVRARAGHHAGVLKRSDAADLGSHTWMQHGIS